jgi:uncharacterized protein (DUF58 family)
MRSSLTPTGRALLALSAGAYVVGWAFGYDDLFVVAASCAAALVLGLLWVLPNTRVRLDHRVEPESVTVGGAAYAHVVVNMDSPRRQGPLTIEDRVGDHQVVSTLGHREVEVSYPLPTDRRGVFEVGPARIRRRDPLGLWQRTQSFGIERLLFVYPRRHAVDPVAAGRRHDLNGPNAASASQGTIAFHSLREYRSGDDLRSVHWKTSARTGTLMVRQQADSSQPQTTVVLDNRAGSHSEASFELAVEIAASVVATAASLVLPVELRTTDGDQVGALGLPSAAAVFLNKLAGVQLSDSGSLALIAHAVRAAPSDTLVIVTTTTAAHEDQLTLTALTQRFDSITIVNVRPEEGAYPEPGGSALVINSASGHEFARVWNAGWA